MKKKALLVAAPKRMNWWILSTSSGFHLPVRVTTSTTYAPFCLEVWSTRCFFVCVSAWTKHSIFDLEWDGTGPYLPWVVPLCLYWYYPSRSSRFHYSGLWLHTTSPISGPWHVSVPSLVNLLLWLHDDDVIWSLVMKLKLSSRTVTRQLLLIIILFYLSLCRSVYSNQASVLRFLTKAYLKVCTDSSNFWL